MFTDGKIDRRKFFQNYLKEFYIENIDKKIFDSVFDIKFPSNIIIYSKMRFDTIKNIVASLLVKDKKVYDFFSLGISDFMQNMVFHDGNESDSGNTATLIGDKRLLIFYEYGDQYNSLFPELITSVLMGRCFKGNPTVFIITTRQDKELFIDSSIKENFTVLDFTGLTLVTKQKEQNETTISRELY
ncbi:MAG: hypothetical protein WC774_04670 [Candidatus Gracilibacteria bacterium]|jgi:hypothetical protein